MDLFLQRKVDAAAAMTYNELAQVLENKNPKTGKLYTAADLNVFKMASPSVGTGMLEDNIFATQKYAAAIRRTQATIDELPEGVVPGLDLLPRPRADCTNIVLKNGTALGHGHQLWQMNEINKLVWPNPSGVGLVPTSALNATAKIAKTYGVIKKSPSGAWNYTWPEGARPAQGGPT